MRIVVPPLIKIGATPFNGTSIVKIREIEDVPIINDPLCISNHSATGKYTDLVVFPYSTPGVTMNPLPSKN